MSRAKHRTSFALDEEPIGTATIAIGGRIATANIDDFRPFVPLGLRLVA